MTCIHCHRPVNEAGRFVTFLVTTDDDDRSCYGDDLPLDELGRGHQVA